MYPNIPLRVKRILELYRGMELTEKVGRAK